MDVLSVSRVLPSLLQVLLTTPPGECCHVWISLSDAGVNSKNPSELFPVRSSGGRTAASLSELRQLLEDVAPLSFAAAKVFQLSLRSFGFTSWKLVLENCLSVYSSRLEAAEGSRGDSSSI